MAEAEDVITDVARHATVYAQALWRRHRLGVPGPAQVALRDVAQRLDLLVSAVFGRSYTLRVAEPPAPATFLTKVFRGHEGPRVAAAVPATDDSNIWLPGVLREEPGLGALDRYRALALHQAARAQRHAAARAACLDDTWQRAVAVVVEAWAAEAELGRLLPGLAPSLRALRLAALARRPPLERFPPARRTFEAWVRAVMAGEPRVAIDAPEPPAGRSASAIVLYADEWTGELRSPQASGTAMLPARDGDDDHDPDRTPPHSARLARSPQVRKPSDEEDDDAQPGAWMVQTAQPHEQAEDPMGLQRPTDRDAETAADDYADALSELPEARLVSSPGRPKEVLLSEDRVAADRAQVAPAQVAPGEQRHRYPEWDYRAQAYREHGATVHVHNAGLGARAEVERILEEHRALAQTVRRRFEMLRARPVRLRQQPDGDEIDLDACTDAFAAFRAGLPMPQGLYTVHRAARRDLAILLLVDVSGSTDGWVSHHKRVIDVEREALLLMCIALQGLGELHAVLAFSGEGPHGVVVRPVKAFDETYGDDVARRIVALEPEHYTRAGAALRHATMLIMRQPAQHRLLLVLSDGKPNDVDDYEGRYGVEDMRQAVTEARLQGVQPFCLTVDRQGASYLPAVFGAHHYALLPRPELLPTVLLDWLKRLVQA